MSFAFKSRVTTAVVAALCSVNVAAQTDKLHTAQQINGPVKTEPVIKVTANIPKNSAPFIASAHWGQGFLMTPTGSGYGGRAYATANRAPSAIPSNNPNPCDSDGDPILPATGAKVETYPLFALPGEMGLTYVLYYSSSYWSDNLSYGLQTNCDVNPPDTGNCKQTMLYLHRPDGSSLSFFGGPTATSYTGGGGVATLTRDAISGDFTLKDEDATTKVYTANGALKSLKNASGVGWTINSSGGGITTVTHTNGQSFSIRHVFTSMSPVREVDTITDPAGNLYTIHDAQGRQFTSITYPGSPSTVVGFKYLSFGSYPYGSRLSEVNYNGTPYSYTTYETKTTSNFPNPFYRWATGTYLADGSESVSIAYNADNSSLKNQTATITNPLGHQSTKNYDANGNITLISNKAVQTCGATTSGRTYDGNGHLAAEIDNNGNTHSYTYAANGQLQTEAEAYGTPIARTTSYVWDPDQRLNRMLSVTVKGWKKTAYTYNAQNRLASVAVTNLGGWQRQPDAHHDLRLHAVRQRHGANNDGDAAIAERQR